jgi:WD40 repeat protein
MSRLCFSPDGQKLYSGGRDGTIYRWSAQGQPPEREPGFWRSQAGLWSVTVTPDMSRFAGLRQGGVYVGEAQAATPPSQVVELGTNNTCLLFSADGRGLFAGTDTGEIQVWSLGGREPLRRLRGLTEPAGTLLRDKHGHILVAVHGEKKAQLNRPIRVAVWNAADWHLEQSFIIGAQYGYEVSPDGRWLATAYLSEPLRLRSLTEPSQVKTMPCPGPVGSIVFSPDGRLLAGASVEGVVRVWEMPTLREVTTFQARSQALFAIAFTPDSQRLATAGEATEAIKLWDVATWQELIILPLEGERLSQLLFSADGHQLAARNSQGDVLFWRAPSFAEIEAKEKNAMAR